MACPFHDGYWHFLPRRILLSSVDPQSSSPLGWGLFQLNDWPYKHAYLCAVFFSARILSRICLSTNLSSVFSRKKVRLTGRKSFRDIHPFLPTLGMKITFVPLQALRIYSGYMPSASGDLKGLKDFRTHLIFARRGGGGFLVLKGKQLLTYAVMMAAEIGGFPFQSVNISDFHSCPWECSL